MNSDTNLIESIEKKAISILTEDISKNEFIENGKEKWEVLPGRGVEPCLECSNGFNIRKFLKVLNNLTSKDK